MSDHIGIVACSAEGAALCYRTICVEGAQLLGPRAHPEVSMHTHSLAEYMQCIYRGDWQGLSELMLSSAVHLYHSVAANALRQIPVDCPNADFLDTLIFGRDPCGGGQCVVGLELDHRPCDDAHRGERIFQRVELREKRRLNALAHFVAMPKAVSKRLDDVIGRNVDVTAFLLQHLERRL